jgi:hypothetical protein
MRCLRLIHDINYKIKYSAMEKLPDCGKGRKTCNQRVDGVQ